MKKVIKKEVKKEKIIKKETSNNSKLEKLNFIKKIIKPIKDTLKLYDVDTTEMVIGQKVYAQISIPLKTVYDIKKEEIKANAENSIIKKGQYSIIDYNDFVSKLPNYFKNVGITTSAIMHNVIKKCINYQFVISNKDYLDILLEVKKVDNQFPYNFFSEIYIITHFENAVYYTITGQKSFK